MTVAGIDIRQRTDAEKLAYLDGYDAALRMIGWRLLTQPSYKALREAQAAGELARATVKLEGE